MAFVKAQDSYGFLDGTSTPPARQFRIRALLQMLLPP
jgi:hypothetical protein